MKLSLPVLLSLGFLCTNTFALEHQNTKAATEKQAEKQMITKPTQDFLTANKKKPGVITLSDGLQYKIIKKGHGIKPTNTDLVTVHYSGTLTNGVEFDSSYKRNAPATFPVSGVIAGWTEALQLMPVGSIWELYIPAELAYGSRGAPPMIGPNQTLVFKVELLSIQK